MEANREPEGQRDVSQQLERHDLRLLLLLNGAMFVVEGTGGYFFDSMGLVADSLDMLADAAVYAVAILAIGATAEKKVKAAFTAGYLQLGIALAAVTKLGDAVLRGSEPAPGAMIGLSLVALCVNVAALIVLRRHRHGDVHLRAAWIFSTTDVQVNLGVICAAVLVSMLESSIPDLMVGAVIVAIVFRGVWRILNDARRTRAELRKDASISIG